MALMNVSIYVRTTLEYLETRISSSQLIRYPQWKILYMYDLSIFSMFKYSRYICDHLDNTFYSIILETIT